MHPLHSQALTHDLSLSNPPFVFLASFSLFLFVRRELLRQRWRGAAARTVGRSGWPRTIMGFSFSSYPFRFLSVPATQAGESKQNEPSLAHTGSDMNSGEFYLHFIPFLLRFVQRSKGGREWGLSFGFLNHLKSMLSCEFGHSK